MNRRDEAKAVQSTFNLWQSDHLAVLEAHRVASIVGEESAHRLQLLLQ